MSELAQCAGIMRDVAQRVRAVDGDEQFARAAAITLENYAANAEAVMAHLRNEESAHDR